MSYKITCVLDSGTPCTLGRVFETQEAAQNHINELNAAFGSYSHKDMKIVEAQR